MAVADIFNVDKQLTFYGAYHSNKLNVIIHVICVPIILWSFQVLAAPLAVPSSFPVIQHTFNQYLALDINWPFIAAAVYLGYYFMLEPVAALLYTPQMILSVLSATAFAKRPDSVNTAIFLQVVSWVAQFVGHGVAEKRAPALLDNLVGALVLAPFFVHLELLFGAGYRPSMHKRINNAIGVEITKIRKAEGEKKRAKAAAAKSQ